MTINNNLSMSEVYGDIVKMQRSNSLHYNEEGIIPTGSSSSSGTSFKDMVVSSLSQTSGLEMESQSLFQTMVTNPDSVEVHEVTIAMAKADMALSLTKAVVDAAVKAYQDITSFR